MQIIEIICYLAIKFTVLINTVQWKGLFILKNLNRMVCEVLIWANYVSCCGLIFISAHCTYHSSMLVDSLSYVSVQILQKSGNSCFAVWPKRPKDHGGCVHHTHNDIAALLHVANFPKHPCRCGILWSQSL